MNALVNPSKGGTVTKSPKASPHLWRSVALYIAATVLTAIPLYNGLKHISLPSDLRLLPTLSLPSIAYLLAMFMLPALFARGRVDSAQLQQRWTTWLRVVGCIALAALLMPGTAIVGASWEEALVIVLLGAGAGYGAGTAVTLILGLLGPQGGTHDTDAISAPVMPRWFRPVYALGGPSRVLAARLSRRVALSAGIVLVISSLALRATISDTGLYRGYSILSGGTRWATAEHLAQDVAQQVSAWAAAVAYACGLLAAGLALFLLLGRDPRRGFVRAAAALSSVAMFFTVADLFAAMQALFGQASWLPHITFTWLAAAAAVWIAGRRSGQAELARVRLATLYVPVVLISYGMLILVAAFEVWSLVAHACGIQLLWWGCVQTARNPSQGRGRAR